MEDLFLKFQLWWTSFDDPAKLLFILTPLIWLLKALAEQIIKILPHKWLAGALCTVGIIATAVFVVSQFYKIPTPPQDQTLLHVHIQTWSGKVTPIAKRVRQELAFAGYPTDYGKVFDLTTRPTNLILTSPGNGSAAERILQVLLPLGLGQFTKDSEPNLKNDEVHIFLRSQ
jgi:hypothetical protein